jgi:DNA polymerase-4
MVICDMALRALFVDFNSYFASVEQQEHEELRGKPIAVVPVIADTTVAIAASYEAKKFGVTTGTVIAEAKKMCPDLILVHAKHGKYIEYHHRLVEAVESCLHVQRVMSIDEMVCDLTGSMQQRDRAVAAAHEIKQKIASTVGTELRCSIGIGPNTFIAKLASDMQKPDGLTVIEQEDLPQALHHLDLRDITGIGKQMHKRIWKQGIYTVEMLCAATKDQLRAAWGGVEGERMWARLRGENVPVTETHKTTVGHSHVLEPSLRTRDGAAGVMHRLLQKAAMRLRSYELLAANLAVKIRYRDGQKWKADMDVTPTQDSIQFTAVLNAMLDTRPHTDAQPISVALSLNKLSPVDAITVPLFENTGPAREKLNAALDKMNSKYGKNTLYIGGAHGALSSAPMRIAFTHIPDIETDDDD